MAIGNPFERTVEVTTASVMMKQVIDHTNRNGSMIESLIHDLVMQWMGPYEDAALARNWQERQNIFARNAHRKTTRLAMEEYLMREGTFKNESAEQSTQEG
jgi:hypothetical protein